MNTLSLPISAPFQAAPRLFPSFFIGGFECSTHVLRNGRRLDQLLATRHLEFIDEDYARLRDIGIRTAREGVRWHLIERVNGQYDLRDVTKMARAAHAAGIQVIWDLLHFGWPDRLDIWDRAFVERFGRFANAVAKAIRQASPDPLYIAPVNEISFLSWVGGEVGHVNPFVEGRGFELKCQLVRASIAATDAVRAVEPNARFFQNEPVFNVVAQPDRPGDAEAAEAYRQYQFQVWDLLSGRLLPEIGGAEHYLDVIGVNYYPWNQWCYDGPLHAGNGIGPSDAGWKPFDSMLAENFQRYQRPIFVAETGCENDKRAPWFDGLCGDVAAARQAGVPVEGVCLYPIVNFPGWDDERHCHNGLWDYADDHGERAVHAPLAEALSRHQTIYADWHHGFQRTDSPQGLKLVELVGEQQRGQR